MARTIESATGTKPGSAGEASLGFGFEHLGLSEILAISRPANSASGRVIEKLGMRLGSALAIAYQGGIMSAVMLVHHRVADFDVWKAGYDDFRAQQREAGVRHHHVWRSRSDPNTVVVVHTFDSADAAESFLKRPDLEQRMSELGVDASSLQVEFLNAVDGGAL